jgi:hypothetical protein
MISKAQVNIVISNTNLNSCQYQAHANACQNVERGQSLDIRSRTSLWHHSRTGETVSMICADSGSYAALHFRSMRNGRHLHQEHRGQYDNHISLKGLHLCSQIQIPFQIVLTTERDAGVEIPKPAPKNDQFSNLLPQATEFVTIDAFIEIINAREGFTKRLCFSILNRSDSCLRLREQRSSHFPFKMTVRAHALKPLPILLLFKKIVTSVLDRL